MNCFEYNNFCSPVIKAWSNEDMIYDQEDNTSVLSFLRGDAECEVANFDQVSPHEQFDFGLNWLIEEDRNQLFGSNALKTKIRASSFHVLAEDNRVSARFSQLCGMEEDQPKTFKVLEKPEKPPKTKTFSVKSGKTRIT